jgi:hypothetical protein
MTTKILGALCAAALVGGLLAAPTAARARSEQPAPEVVVRPAVLQRGPDAAVPRLQGRRVVDGDVRVAVPGTEPQLYGATADGYVVGSVVDDRWQVTTLRAGAPPFVLARRAGLDVLADPDSDVVVLAAPSSRRTPVRVVVPTTGDVVARRVFAGWSRVLDVAAGSVALVAEPDATSRWHLDRDRVRRVSDLVAYEADLTHDRMASFTDDPFLGGCTVVSAVSRPQVELWRSCREAVAAFSTDGRRVVTVHLLTDGPGARQVWERTVRGRELASYRVRGAFTRFAWESPTALLLDAWVAGRVTAVRCTQGVCERASRAVPIA